jgi:hypothetical protein
MIRAFLFNIKRIQPDERHSLAQVFENLSIA